MIPEFDILIFACYDKKGMADQKRNIIHFGILLFFLLSIAFANFFHTEKSPFENDRCPACNLLKFTQATSQIHFFHLAKPIRLETLPVIEFSHYSHIAVFQRSARSPPQVG